MRQNRSIPTSTVVPELAYPDVTVAAKWLCENFGLQQRLRIGDHRVQLLVGDGGAMVVTERSANVESAGSCHGLLVRVENVDQHYSTSVAQGVRILRPPQTYSYGERQYTAEDIGGHPWTFSESVEDVDPESWGGVLSSE